MSFYNFNSNIGSQVIGTQVNTDSANVLAQEVELLLKTVRISDSADAENRIKILQALIVELRQNKPDKSLIGKYAGVLFGLDAATGLFDRICAWLNM